MTLLQAIKLFLSKQYRHTAAKFRFHHSIDCHYVPVCRTRSASVLFGGCLPEAELTICCFGEDLGLGQNQSNYLLDAKRLL